MEIKVKLANGFEFDVDELAENKGDIPGDGTLTIRSPIKTDVNTIMDNLTAENLKTITALGDGKVIFEFRNYAVTHAETKTINKFSQMFVITLRQGNEED